MRDSRTIQSKQTQYGKLRARLAKLGYVLQGTIYKRRIVLPHPTDPEKTRSFGPYYQWTFKLEGKSVTVNLTTQQAVHFQRAITNHHRLEAILRTMRTLSRDILETTAPGVVRRNPRS